MPASQAATFNLQEFADNGITLVGGRLYTFFAGTTTFRAAFTDPAALIPHTYTSDDAGQYIALNARGELPAPLYLASGGYDLTLKRADGSTVWTRRADGVENPVIEFKANLATAVGAALVGFPSSPGRTIGQQLDMLYFGSANVTDPQFAGGADPTGVKDSTAAIQAAYSSGAKNIHFPQTSASYRISNTITYSAEQVTNGDIASNTRIVMTDDTKWAFACDPVLPSSSAGHTYEIQGGGFFGLDIRAKYGIRLGTPNFASPPNYDYASFADFIAASQQVQNFEVHDCVFMPKDDYSAGYAYIAASPGWNTTTPPSISDLYARGVGVMLCNAYRASVKGNTMKFSGMAVWLYGSDFATVERNRIANCLRWVNVQGIWTGGYQCKIKHNDFLSSYRWGGLYTRWVNHTLIEDNYFENSGADTNSTINYYVVDTGVCTNLLGNRFDDYGSTKTTGPLIVFNGPAGALCANNRVADNRPGGAGTLATLLPDPSNWSPAATGLSCGWGSVQMGANDPSWPRIRHPLVQYDLDGDPLKWAPLAAKRDTAFRDYSGGGVMNSFKFEKDAAGLWFLNPGPFQNGLYMKPAQTQLTKGLNYVVTVRSRCVVPVAPFNVTWTISWVTAAGVKTDLFAAEKTYATNTAIEELTQAVSIPAASEGSFVINVDEVGADLYSIEISEA